MGRGPGLVDSKRQRGQEDPGGVGTAGEEAALRYLAQKHGKGAVRDVRNDSTYQIRDIDYILPDGTTVEVKTDTWVARTGNLFFETARNHGRAGCFYRSKADLWVYIDAHAGGAYVFPLSEAQAWLAHNFNLCQLTSTRSRGWENGKRGYVTFMGFKVPASEFVRAPWVELVDLGAV